MGLMMRRVSAFERTNTSATAATSATSTGTSMSPRNDSNEWRVSDRRTMEPSSSFTAAYKVSVSSVSEWRMVTASPDTAASCTSGRSAWLPRVPASAALSNSTVPSAAMSV